MDFVSLDSILKIEAEKEELERPKPAIMSEEGNYTVCQIKTVNNSSLPWLSIVDDPEVSAYSLKNSAGIDSIIKTVRVEKDNNINKIYKLQFVEASKQGQFKFLRDKFKPNAIIIEYDATEIASFDRAKQWLEENQTYANGSVFMFLVGNDNDLDDNDENKVVQTNTAEELANNFEIHFIETSPARLEQAFTNITNFIESSKIQLKIHKAGAVSMKGKPIQQNNNCCGTMPLLRLFAAKIAEKFCC